jgi:hypothetical protein
MGTLESHCGQRVTISKTAVTHEVTHEQLIVQFICLSVSHLVKMQRSTSTSPTIIISGRKSCKKMTAATVNRRTDIPTPSTSSSPNDSGVFGSSPGLNLNAASEDKLAKLLRETENDDDDGDSKRRQSHLPIDPLLCSLEELSDKLARLVCSGRALNVDLIELRGGLRSVEKKMDRLHSEAVATRREVRDVGLLDDLVRLLNYDENSYPTDGYFIRTVRRTKMGEGQQQVNLIV